LAAKLDERGTLSGAEIDELIAEAETTAVHAAELACRSPCLYFFRRNKAETEPFGSSINRYQEGNLYYSGQSL